MLVGHTFPIRRFILLVFCFSLTCLSAIQKAKAEDWIAPPSKAEVVNPIGSNQDSLDRGRAIFIKRCENCHGSSGQGDGVDASDLSVQPPQFKGESFIRESDGALFWKISTGRKPMPRYGHRLSENDIWDVINFIRTFGK